MHIPVPPTEPPAVPRIHLPLPLPLSRARPLPLALPLPPALALALALALAAAPAAAQEIVVCEDPRANPLEGCAPFEPPHWVGEFTLLGANALLGGVTAGVMQRVRGGSFRDGFARGALGGTIVYAGKRTAAERFFGAGFMGREVAAVGSSIVRNAAEGAPSLDRLILPLGPVRLHVTPAAEPRVRAKVDVATLVWTAYAAQEERLQFDARRTLSAGAPVFRVRNLLMAPHYGSHEGRADGLSASGILMLSEIDEWGPRQTERTFAHERIHVLQDDYLFTVWSQPAGEWLLRRVPGGERIDRYIDVNLVDTMRGLLSVVISERRNQPWELEANFLERR
jgi:hypothetical protein